MRRTAAVRLTASGVRRGGVHPNLYAEAGSGLPVQVADAAVALATVTPNVAGTAHVILAVTDNGSPALTSYRRVVLTIQPAAR
jgi:hypothetical protein